VLSSPDTTHRRIDAWGHRMRPRARRPLRFRAGAILQSNRSDVENGPWESIQSYGFVSRAHAQFLLGILATLTLDVLPFEGESTSFRLLVQLSTVEFSDVEE
jgi:hypothetical protein